MMAIPPTSAVQNKPNATNAMVPLNYDDGDKEVLSFNIAQTINYVINDHDTPSYNVVASNTSNSIVNSVLGSMFSNCSISNITFNMQKKNQNN